MNLYASSSEERLTLGQAGNRHCLAPQGLPAVLDLESQPRPAWPTGGPERRARTESKNEPQALAVPGNDGFRLDRELISLLRNSHTSSLIRSTSSLLVKYAKLCAGVC